MSGWQTCRARTTLWATPFLLKKSSRRSENDSTEVSHRPNDRRSFSCSCAGSRSTPPCTEPRPQAGPRRYRLPLPAECSEDSHGHRCESQLQSPPHYRRLSPYLLAPRPSPVPTAAAGLSQFQFPQPDRCGDDTSKTRVRLRSVVAAPLLQSPVQRAGRAGRPSEASPYASAHDSREGRLVLAFISYL